MFGCRLSGKKPFRFTSFFFRTFLENFLKKRPWSSILGNLLESKGTSPGMPPEFIVNHHDPLSLAGGVGISKVTSDFHEICYISFLSSKHLRKTFSAIFSWSPPCVVQRTQDAIMANKGVHSLLLRGASRAEMWMSSRGWWSAKHISGWQGLGTLPSCRWRVYPISFKHTPNAYWEAYVNKPVASFFWGYL